MGHLRRSSAMLLGPTAAILIAYMTVSDFHRWRFEWDWGMLVPGSALIVLGPLLAAGAALDAVRARMLLTDLAPGKEAARRSVWAPFVALAVVSLSLWLLALIPVFMVLAASDATGSVRWLPLLAQGIAFPGFVASGVLVGLILPRWWVPPVLGVAVYVIPILWRDTAFAIHPVVVATYLSGIGTPVAHSFVVLVVSIALILIIAPMSAVSREARLNFRRAVRALLVVAVVAGVSGDLSPALAAEGTSSCRQVSLSTICTAETYAESMDYVGSATTDTLRDIEALGVELPPLLVVSEWVTAEHVGAGLIVGVHPGLVRPEWVPDPRYAGDDLLSRVRYAIGTGSCAWWWSDDEPPGWAASLAAEIIDAYLYGRSAPEFELATSSGDETTPGDQMERVELTRLVQAVIACDERRIESVLIQAGIQQP